MTADSNGVRKQEADDDESSDDDDDDLDKGNVLRAQLHYHMELEERRALLAPLVERRPVRSCWRAVCIRSFVHA
jgi:hypothetical protein